MTPDTNTDTNDDETEQSGANTDSITITISGLDFPDGFDEHHRESFQEIGAEVAEILLNDDGITHENVECVAGPTITEIPSACPDCGSGPFEIRDIAADTGAVVHAGAMCQNCSWEAAAIYQLIDLYDYDDFRSYIKKGDVSPIIKPY